MTSLTSAIGATLGTTDRRRRVLAVTCGVHALHDGFTDLIYVLLPVWQAEFALSYAALGVLRMLFTGAMASFQLPMSHLARRVGGPLLLAIGTALAGGAYLTIGLSGAGFVMLAAALMVGGVGAAVQHPIGSALVSAAYATHGSRSALGTYNFAGDLGKMALPAATAWLLVVMPWRPALGLIGMLGIGGAVAILLLLPSKLDVAPEPDVAARTVPRCAHPTAPAAGVSPAAGHWHRRQCHTHGFPGVPALRAAGERRGDADHWHSPHADLHRRCYRQVGLRIIGCAARRAAHRDADRTRNRAGHRGAWLAAAGCRRSRACRSSALR